MKSVMRYKVEDTGLAVEMSGRAREVREDMHEEANQ